MMSPGEMSAKLQEEMEKKKVKASTFYSNAYESLFSYFYGSLCKNRRSAHHQKYRHMFRHYRRRFDVRFGVGKPKLP